ncbi:hypothetical protein HGRIS_009437 [Hohenbuehelia grisea]|uniref:Uncharacterized protein n=1 Tax=Hohenbuehelia grisea TaxID=104357 RepID=A0ABR3J184_9AGAR
MSSVLRNPYTGTKRLVVAIDIGTTYTAASFCILKPGFVPKFEEILSWPAQAVADAKVPSVVYYDAATEIRAIGAETEDEDMVVEAEDNGWHKAEWWKLHLRPEHLPLVRGLELPELPPGVSTNKVLSDFFGFVKRQIQIYIQRSYADGSRLWDELFPSMFAILTTPNGWEGIQQARMREAAISGGLVDADGGRRIRFVTEAEAAVLYAANTGNVEDWLFEGGNVILCDCGGGTIDISGYTIRQTSPLRLEESSAPLCYLAGGVHISNKARIYFANRLSDTKWGHDDAIRRVTEQFDRNMKKKFCDVKKVLHVQLDGHESDASLGIVRGRMRVSGKDIEGFFRPSVVAILDGLRTAWENGNRLADSVILVGGLAGSPYVYDQILQWGKMVGVSISKPDGPSTKAVASGALAWHLDASVSTRVARYHYGKEVRAQFDPADPTMRGRPIEVDYITGEQMVNHFWSCIVEKDTRVDAQKEFWASYVLRTTGLGSQIHSSAIYVYRKAKTPKFVTSLLTGNRLPGFEVLCHVKADLQPLWDATAFELSAVSCVRYKSLMFKIHITLVDTEISAKMSWEVNGVTRYSPAVVAYD